MKRQIGDVTVERIEESIRLSFPPSVLFPEFEPEALDRHRDWLVPHHFDAGEGKFRTSVHSFLLKTPKHTILIDTCGGDGKHRPYFPRFHQQKTGWLDRLGHAGVAPEQVDFVFCTHLHLDHVGWNTRQVDGRWVPTFPNAKYVVHRRELARWNPADPSFTFAPHNQFVWEDSIAPIIAADQVLAVDDGFELDGLLRVEPAPGHTLGHVRIRLLSKGKSAYFSGDVMHVPLQVYYPHWHTSLDDDPALGVASRRRLLGDCAGEDALLLPTHFVAPHCCRIRDRKGTFAIEWVAS
jgi:glyoxylase-like metal-dependent hydrolase (beta-lactamase superfamily II)